MGATMFSNIPPVTKALLVANGVVFLLQQLVGDPAFAAFMLWPLGSADTFGFGPSTVFLPWSSIGIARCRGAAPGCIPGCRAWSWRYAGQLSLGACTSPARST